MRVNCNETSAAWREIGVDRVVSWTAWFLIAAGTAARIIQYGANRALWLDEAVLARHMLHDSAAKLFGALGDCMAPPGYLLLGKALIAVMGPCEFAVRMPSLIAGIASLVLFYSLAKRLTGELSAVAGLAIMAVNAHLIYYSAEVRPYAMDAAILLLILWIAAPLLKEDGPPSWPRIGCLTVIGALAPWFSFPSVFVVAGVVFTQVLLCVRNRSARDIRRYAVAWTAFAASVAVLYWAIIVRVSGDSQTMRIMNGYYKFAGAFVPLPPTSWNDARALWLVFLRTFDNPAGTTWPVFGGSLWVMGCLIMLLQNTRAFVLLVAPLGFALAASAMGRYPFYGRTILYIAPVIALPIGVLLGCLAQSSRWKGAAAAAVLAAVLLAHPAARATRNAIRPPVHHELKPLLKYAQTHWQAGDLLYVPYPVNYAYDFCRSAFTFPAEGVFVEPDIHAYSWEERRVFLANQMPLWARHARVWVPFTADLQQGIDDWWALIDEQGKVRCAEEYRRAGAALRLYVSNR